MNPIAIVTDSSAVASALCSWLDELLEGRAISVVARGPQDVVTVVEARRAARTRERIVAIARGPLVAGVDIDASSALAVVSRWFAGLSPMEIRSRGATRIRDQLAHAAPGSDALEELAALLRMPSPTVGRRGRPRGSDPFRGVSLELIVTLLLAPDVSRTERDLAAAIERSPFAVHRALTQLAARGYTRRDKAGTRVRDAELLRDDLVSAWRARVTLVRSAVAFLSPNRKRAVTDVLRAARGAGCEVLLAGPSAVAGPTASASEATVFYLDGDPKQVLEPAGFVATSVSDVVIWPVPERAVLLAPRLVGSMQATNRVITYADLMMMPTDRQAEAARSVWAQS